MADIPAANWSETDGSNNSASPDGAPEGMAPGGINEVLRAMMGAVKRWFDWTIPKITAGTTTAYTLSYTVAPGALVDGMPHLVQFNATCGASPTLNVNTLGAKPIHKFSGGAWVVCAAADILSGSVHRVSYNVADGTYRITSSSSSIGAALLAVANTFTAALSMSGAAINEAHGADIASASTINLDTATGNLVDVTGTTTITAITLSEGRERTVRFTGALTLTHGSSLVLPNAANIKTVAGDFAVFRGYAAGVVRLASYMMGGTTRYTNSAIGDVLLANNALYYTAATVAQGTAGAWKADGGASFGGSSIACNYVVRLTDGTSVFDSKALSVAAGGYASASVSGYAVSPAGNLRVEVQNQTAVDSSFVYDRSGNAKDCTITVVRIG